MKIKIFSIFLILISIPDHAYSDICSENRYNICQTAKTIQKEMAKNTPQKISKNILMRSVTVFDNQLTINAMLLYDKQFLEDAVRKGNRTMSSINSQMKETTIKYICSTSDLSRFIKEGGKLSYQYQFNDGEKYLSIHIRSCR